MNIINFESLSITKTTTSDIYSEEADPTLSTIKSFQLPAIAKLKIIESLDTNVSKLFVVQVIMPT